MKTLHNKHNVETLLVKVSGRVQGVGFRVATVRHAHLQGVRGWVRNLEDGTVQALLQGSHDQVDRMLSWLHHGPAQARVDAVEHQEADTERYFDRFEAI